MRDYLADFVPDFRLEPARTALLVVDMQYASGSRSHGLGRLLRALFALTSKPEKRQTVSPSRARGQSAAIGCRGAPSVVRVENSCMSYQRTSGVWRHLRRRRARGAMGMPSDAGPSLRGVSDREEATVHPMDEALELLLIEEADAWFEYLEATRNQSEVRYGEVEPWAWARLHQRLRAIRARRAKLRPAAA